MRINLNELRDRIEAKLGRKVELVTDEEASAFIEIPVADPLIRIADALENIDRTLGAGLKRAA